MNTIDPPNLTPAKNEGSKGTKNKVNKYFF